MQGEDRIHNRQFIFSTERIANLSWPAWQIQGRWLQVHPNTEVTFIRESERELYLVGYVFDSEQATFSNRDILNTLTGLSSFADVIERLDDYAGRGAVM